ncbi:cyclophilin-like fold protein [uncultured Mailhella sp.]|uniref:cyclophilin-like fold protein n=1 Tax=uncultured Mailhella sp. TaxID=1981031 RepID=UPI0025F3D15A|nr:cyclophilin-like fold protein [uncultured Mailhella sp.]
MKPVFAALCSLAVLALSSASADAAEKSALRLTINGNVLSATLEDSPAARDFRAMLPLTLNMRDFNGTEKISDLPRRLSEKDAPEGVTPVAGDLAYYAPWGNLAVFYRDFSWSRGLIRLGRITSDIAPLVNAGNGDTLIIEEAD